MSQKIPLLTLTAIATAILAAERFTTAAGAYPAAAANAFGVTNTNAAIGDRVAVDVIGTTVVTAGAPITAGAYLQVGADGKAVPRVAGVTVAQALQAASADGDRIEVLLISNGATG
jgi:hypothetical protein